MLLLEGAMQFPMRKKIFFRDLKVFLNNVNCQCMDKMEHVTMQRRETNLPSMLV